jgi:hypothetical protein
MIFEKGVMAAAVAKRDVFFKNSLLVVMFLIIIYRNYAQFGGVTSPQPSDGRLSP